MAMSTASPCTWGRGMREGAQWRAMRPSPAARQASAQHTMTPSEEVPAATRASWPISTSPMASAGPQPVA